MKELWRSWLFSPGNHPERCRKALASPADQVILDLEDGVAPADKGDARANILDFIAHLGPGERVPWVRLNALSSDRGREDLDVLSRAFPADRRRFVVPKADRDSFARAAERSEGAGWLFIVETASGLTDLLREPPTGWAGSDLRLAFGPLDLLLDLGATPDPDELDLLFFRQSLVVASRAWGLPAPIDGVFPDVADEAGLAASAARAHRLGFAGKLVIHPRQIATVRAAFRPAQDEIRWAERVLAAFPDGAGAALVDGSMVDEPVLKRARAVVEAAGRDDAADDDAT